METAPSTDTLTLPADLLAQIRSEAAKDHRPAADLLRDLLEQGLMERREWQAHAEQERQRARELGIHEPADDEPMTDEYRQAIREKIAQGLASAQQGKLVDGASVFARIRAELDQIEQQERG